MRHERERKCGQTHTQEGMRIHAVAYNKTINNERSLILK
jgi:hypothetical protein